MKENGKCCSHTWNSLLDGKKMYYNINVTHLGYDFNNMSLILTKIKPLGHSIQNKKIFKNVHNYTCSDATLVLVDLCLYFLHQKAFRQCCQMRKVSKPSQSPFEIWRFHWLQVTCISEQYKRIGAFFTALKHEKMLLRQTYMQTATDT